MEQRAIHAEEPHKFLESEIELDEAIRAMHALATSPELYPDLVTTSGAVPTFISLLHHENGDIAAAGIELISELTDADAVEDSEAEAAVLVDALLDAGLLEALVQKLRVLDERVAEEAAAVYNALSVLENAVELRPEIAASAAAHPGLLEWMMKRLRPKAATDGNKQYTAEVLAVVLQSGGDPSRKRFVELNGIELMLRAVAPYKSRDPETAEEEEFIENAFDVLCAVLMEDDAKKAFVDADGAELMVLIVKGRKGARTGALKCLDFATTRFPAACDQVVDFGGLGTLFSLFMGKLKIKGKQRRDEQAAVEEEERCMSIIANMLSDATGDARKARVAAKFAENEYEKCDRLIEMYHQYEQRVIQGEARLAASAAEAGEEIDEEELLVAQLDAGLYTLQQAALVAAELWALGDVGVRRRLLALLHQRGKTLSHLRGVLVERKATLVAGLATANEDEEGKKEKKDEDEDKNGVGGGGDVTSDGRRQLERTTMLLHDLGYTDEGGIKKEEDDVEERKKRERQNDGDGGGDEDRTAVRQKTS